MSRMIWSMLAYNRGMLAALVGVCAMVMSMAHSARAAVYLNEIYLDSPGSSDDDEYFEIRGTSGDSLTDVWFIQLENERGAMGSTPGVVDLAVNLSNYSFASSNYLWLASGGGEDYPVGTTVGYNNKDKSGTYSGTIENGGGTFLLIDTNGFGTNPSAGHTWDTNDNGVFDTNWNSNWTVIDSIGTFATSDDITGSNDGRLYADINYSAGTTAGITTEGIVKATTGTASGTPVNLNTDNANFNGSGPIGPTERANAFEEIEYLGRFGDATSKTDATAWIAANLTDNAASGWDGTENDYGVSGDHSGLDDPEVISGVSVAPNYYAPHGYGHNVTTTLGNANSVSYTPEPGSAGMLVVAAIGMMLRGRRARR